MKKILVLIAFISLSLPAFPYLSNVDLECTYVPLGTDETFSIGPLYIDKDGTVYDAKNEVIGNIVEFNSGRTYIKTVDGDELVYVHKQRISSYYYNHKDKRLEANGSCKIIRY